MSTTGMEYIPLLMIISGIVIAFIGKKPLRIVVGVIGGGLLAYATWYLANIFNITGTSVYVLMLLTFIIGYFLAWFVVKLGIGVVAGIGIGLILASHLGLADNLPALLLTVLLSIGIMYLLADKIIGLAVSIAGIALFYYGLKHYVSFEIALGITILFFLLLLYWKVVKKH